MAVVQYKKAPAALGMTANHLHVIPNEARSLFSAPSAQRCVS